MVVLHKKKNSSPKNKNLLKIYPPLGHPACRWVCFFMGIDLDKFSITSLAHQWILCSEWVPSEWESKQLIKTDGLWTSILARSCVFKSKDLCGLLWCFYQLFGLLLAPIHCRAGVFKPVLEDPLPCNIVCLPHLTHLIPLISSLVDCKN